LCDDFPNLECGVMVDPSLFIIATRNAHALPESKAGGPQRATVGEGKELGT